jgi:hypothetical protein
MYSYGSSYSNANYGSSNNTISLPASMPAGAVIGKGGQNIKMLQQRSGDLQTAQPRDTASHI